MTTLPQKQIEFCYNIKSRWPHHIKNKRKLESFQKMVFEAIEQETDFLTDYDEWEIFTHKDSSLNKFSQKEQVLLLKRLKMALVEDNHCYEEEDLILEEALYRVVTGYFDYISDCRNDFKREWNRFKMLAGSDDEETIKEYVCDRIWWDMDSTFWKLKASHIKNYKKILKEYI